MWNLFAFVGYNNDEYWTNFYVSRKQKSSIRYIWQDVRYKIYYQKLKTIFLPNTFHKNKIKIRFVVKFVLLDNVNIIIDDTLSHQVTVEASTKPQHLPRAFKCCQNEYIFNFDTKSCTVPQALARFEKVRHSHLKTLSVWIKSSL